MKIKTLKVNVRSTLIDQLEYDSSSCKLKIKFKTQGFRSKIRSYEGIPISEMWSILESKSIGKAVLKVINRSKSRNYN